MKANFIERVDNEAKFSMEFSAEEFESAQIEVYKNNRQRFSVDGFRKGKAPRKLIETHYGEDVFFDDAVNELLPEAYSEALDTLGIEPVTRPDMDFGELEKGKGFTVTVNVAVPPRIEPKDYKGVKITAVEYSVSDADVDREIETLRERNARLTLTDRPARDGDTVLFDYAGFVGEEQFEGGTAERQSLKLGSGAFIPGFEAQLVGASSGDEKDVKVTFPKDYHAEALAGKEALFRCKIHEVKAEEKPEPDDEFAQDVSEFDTMDALKKNMREKLETDALNRSEYEMKNAVIEQVYLAHDVEIPDVMVENQLDDMFDEFSGQLRSQGLNVDHYLKYVNETPEQLRERMRDDAFKRVKTRLIVRAIADAEGFSASDEEVETELAAMAAQYKVELDKFREVMTDSNLKLLKDDIRNRKAVDFMFAHAKTEKPKAGKSAGAEKPTGAEKPAAKTSKKSKAKEEKDI